MYMYIFRVIFAAFFFIAYHLAHLFERDFASAKA